MDEKLIDSLIDSERKLKADVAEYKERIQKILHVFDLIKDNIINAKIGKRVATLISQTGQTAEAVIETVALTNGMPDMSKKMYVLWTSHRELIEKMATGSDEEKADAKKQLLGVVMRACEGKTNPSLVNQYLDKIATEYNNGRGKFQDELFRWECDTAFSGNQDFENAHFKAIVDMGDKCIPWIHEIIDNHPDPLVHALDVMCPGLMRYEGYVPLNEVCEAWSALLRITHDQKKKVQAELDKQYKADIEDLHSAIRMTCSKPGPSDNSRAAYRHEINQTKERLLKKPERKELLDELEEPIFLEQRNVATIP